jgi:hypothetical protein
MEISPISGIRPLPPARNPQTVIGLQQVFDIENYVRVADESYTPSGEGSGSGMEEDWDEYSSAPEDQDLLPPVKASENQTGSYLNFVV